MNITNKSITDTYLKANGLKRTAGRTDTITALMPFLMMDLQYQKFDKVIKRGNWRFLLKKLRNEWLENYNKFDQAFFKIFDETEQDYIIDKMDAFEEDMNTYIVILRCELINYFREIGVEERKHEILSTAIVCNTIAQAANVIWSRTYLDIYGRPEKNDYIQRVENASMRFADEYHHSPLKIDLNKDKKVVDAMTSLCRHMVSWIGDNLDREEL